MGIRITPCGEFENAFLRPLIAYTQGDSRLSSSYYGPLCRERSQDISDRIATLVALSERAFVASFDWPFRENDRRFYEESTRTLDLEDIGIKLSYSAPIERSQDVFHFVALLIKFGCFDSVTLRHLRDKSSNGEKENVDGIGKFEASSFK